MTDSHGHSHGEETQVTLNVEGMTCAHCAMTVTKVLQNNGAEKPYVDFSSGEARFYLHDAAVLHKIRDGITKAGYKVLSQSEVSLLGKGFAPVEKKFLFTLPFTLPLFFGHLIFPHNFFLNQPLVQLAMCIPVFVVGCMYFGKSAWNSVKLGVPNMDVLIMIGSGAAFVYSVIGTVLFWEASDLHNYLFYETTGTIITLVLLGNVIEHRSVKQTTTAIGELTKLQTHSAKKISIHNGAEKIDEVSLNEIQPGDVLLVNTGDKIPVDGSIVTGSGSIDESMITGESLPVDRAAGDPVIGSTIVVNGSVRVVAEKVGRETVLAQIIEMVKSAQQSKPEIQKLGDKVSSIFVPAVLAIAALTFLISHFTFDISMQRSLMNSIAVLVISCPCAMGLATPTAVMAGIGRAAKNGILIKGGSALEEFAKVKQIVFDKTGTLTTGNFKIKEMRCLNGTTVDEMESVLFNLEQHSSHPVARSIVKELKHKKYEAISFSNINEVKGTGVEAIASNGTSYKAGSYRMAAGFTPDNSHSIYFLKNNALAGWVDLADELKSNSEKTIRFLLSQNISPIMVSGDSAARCNEVAGLLGIKEVYSEQLPAQKLERIEALTKRGNVAMVGDGINDAPALAKASVGISIGNATQVAIHSSQIILLNEKDLAQLQMAYLISKHTLKTIRQNLFWAFFYNVVAIPVAAAGFLSPMIGALAMAFSDVIVIGNSIRLKFKRIK